MSVRIIYLVCRLEVLEVKGEEKQPSKKLEEELNSLSSFVYFESRTSSAPLPLKRITLYGISYYS